MSGMMSTGVFLVITVQPIRLLLLMLSLFLSLSPSSLHGTRDSVIEYFVIVVLTEYGLLLLGLVANSILFERQGNDSL
jgi:hypothetical protein